VFFLLYHRIGGDIKLKKLNKNELKAKYEIIYDKVCDYLDNEFGKNLCDFENDKCGEKRTSISLYRLL